METCWYFLPCPHKEFTDTASMNHANDLKKKNPVSNEAHSGISLGNFFLCVFKEALQKIHPKLPI